MSPPASAGDPPGAAPGELRLLEDPLPVEGSGPWQPYSRPAALLLSLLIAYHAVSVVLHNAPNVEPVRALHAALDRPLGIRTYMAVNGNPRGWGLFAPDANQANFFTKVLLEDATGRVRDLQADIYGRRIHPYLVYDRLGNLNRRIMQDDAGLRPIYAGWFCRDWERSHRGEPARAVTLTRRWTRIPAPDAAYATGGYHPMALFPNEDRTVRYECATLPGGRLTGELRRRYRLPPLRVDDAPVPAPPAAPAPGTDPAETSRDGY